MATGRRSPGAAAPDLARPADAVRRIFTEPELQLGGLHCHLGPQITDQTRSRSPRVWRHSRRTRRGVSRTQPRRGPATIRGVELHLVERPPVVAARDLAARLVVRPRWQATCVSGTSACEHVPGRAGNESRMDAEGERTCYMYR